MTQEKKIRCISVDLGTAKSFDRVVHNSEVASKLIQADLIVSQNTWQKIAVINLLRSNPSKKQLVEMCGIATDSVAFRNLLQSYVGVKQIAS